VLSASIIALMEAERSSETSVYFIETTRPYIPESCYLHTHGGEEMKSNMLIICVTQAVQFKVA
jgi:hypothetical protein